MRRILILGAGFGGLETATGLADALGDRHEITLVDRSDSFFVGFSKIDVLFGRRSEAQVRHRYSDLRGDRVRFVQANIQSIDTDAQSVTTSAGTFGYDYLVVALGADLDHDATPGYRESGAHEFYSMPGVLRLKPVIDAFSTGTLVIGVLGSPYKCPPAPYEVACQLHERFTQRGVRGAITLKMLIPSPQPVPNPAVSDALEKLLADRGIELVPSCAIRTVDGPGKSLATAKGAIGYDLFVGVPVHVAPAVVRSSKLAPQGFIRPSLSTLETQIRDVYAIGDVTTIPVGEAAVPKAGAFAQDAARTVVTDILVKEGQLDETMKFQAKGACYVEVGGGEVGRVKANYFGGDKPQMSFEGPSKDFHADKLHFEASRCERWFKTG